MNPDTSLLDQFLVWIVGGGGAGIFVYWLFENVASLGSLQAEYKRYLSLFGSALLACLAYGAAVGLSYTPEPSGWQAWLEALFAIAFVAIGGSQIIHGRQQLRQA